MKYKHIIFDFGNVLAKFDEQAIIENFSSSKEDFTLIKKAVFYDWDGLDGGFISYEEYTEQALSMLPSRLHANVTQLFRDWCHLLVPMQDTWDLVRELKEKGFSLYILSNASTYFAENVGFYSITKEFDGAVYSGHLKLIKPDPEIYRHLFKTFSLNPEECLFLDDKEKNVQAAQTLGMDAIVFTGDTKPVRALLGLANKGFVH